MRGTLLCAGAAVAVVGCVARDDPSACRDPRRAAESSSGGGPGTLRAASFLSSDVIVVGGTTSYGVGPGNADVHLAVATPDGITRTLDLDGDGGQWLHGLAASTDGAVWLLIDNLPPEDGSPEPVLRIDGRTFAEIGMYLFELVP